uniref:Carboxylesterase type B domain-containing protein n=1 Tax=Timema monikensis TaxID=170555 RepID=A0A7R9E9Y6_9NEOP|nr:unnamed protein product [Timema monikensis]
MQPLKQRVARVARSRAPVWPPLIATNVFYPYGPENRSPPYISRTPNLQPFSLEKQYTVKIKSLYPPQAPESWEGERDATTEGAVAPQITYLLNKYAGKEDCLYLNVHTPQAVLPSYPPRKSSISRYFDNSVFLHPVNVLTPFSPT